ncbi:MAG: 2-hydroxyacyl-CoA dehydratase family protein, partial [Clostridiales Family XIII bacterium]|nr:2-hydroxyacyl-CoA dehydratase family protein [Clostridiales Family XIII bacterium]
TRLGSDPEMAAKYIDVAEKHVAPTMCAIDKVDLGAVFSGDMPDTPDAFIWSSVPCDNSRIAYPAIEEYLAERGCVSLRVDIPFRKDKRGYDYIASQYKDMIPEIEKLAGQSFDYGRFKEAMEISNETMEYMKKIADLRKLKPCPLPGRLLVLNEMIPSMGGHPAMLEFVKKQYEMGKMLVDMGMSASGAQPEKFRVSWLQNMLWSNVATLDWLEKKYGATVVMDAFGYQETYPFTNTDDLDTSLYNLAQRTLALPMIHGASGPIEDYVNLVDQVMGDYSVDVSMFVGHVGCKHTWAAGKVVTDMVQEKYGIPTLYIDVDAVDARYKPKEEIRQIIGDFMDNIVEQKEKGNYPPKAV